MSLEERLTVIQINLNKHFKTSNMTVKSKVTLHFLVTVNSLITTDLHHHSPVLSSVDNFKSSANLLYIINIPHTNIVECMYYYKFNSEFASFARKIKPLVNLYSKDITKAKFNVCERTKYKCF